MFVSASCLASKCITGKRVPPAEQTRARLNPLKPPPNARPNTSRRRAPSTTTLFISGCHPHLSQETDKNLASSLLTLPTPQALQKISITRANTFCRREPSTPSARPTTEKQRGRRGPCNRGVYIRGRGRGRRRETRDERQNAHKGTPEYYCCCTHDYSTRKSHPVSHKTQKSHRRSFSHHGSPPGYKTSFHKTFFSFWGCVRHDHRRHR